MAAMDLNSYTHIHTCFDPSYLLLITRDIKIKKIASISDHQSAETFISNNKTSNSQGLWGCAV